MVVTGNVTGWSSLIEGRIIEAAYVGYNTPLAGYLLLLLFLVITTILILNAGVEVSFVTGLIFLAIFLSIEAINGGAWFNQVSLSIILIVLAAELAGVFYSLVVKTK